MIIENYCAICLQNINLEYDKISLNCNCKYIYHTNCIDEWLNINETCPTCRKKVRSIIDPDIMIFLENGVFVYHFIHVHCRNLSLKQILYIYLQIFCCIVITCLFAFLFNKILFFFYI